MSSHAPDAQDPTGHRAIGGVVLSSIVEAPGPFATLFLTAGESVEQRARVAIDRIPVPAPHAGLLIDAVDPGATGSQIIVVDGNGDVATFLVDDPFSADVACFGDVPSLGPLLEVDQVTASHVAVTVENDVFAVTSFGTVAMGSATDTVFEAIDQLVARLRSLAPAMIALIGTASAIDSTATYLRKRLGAVRLTSYPTSDIDGDLASLADQIVRDAASLAAELQTHELAHFREARQAGQTAEGVDVLTALDNGSAQRLLVHDAVETMSASSTRMVDRVIVEGVRQQIPVTMIPDIPEDRGPRGGIGAILEGDGALVDQAEEPHRDGTSARAAL